MLNHESLGLSVGIIQSQMNIQEKKKTYRCDMTYGTNSEFGFDYLRLSIESLLFFI
ncbi:hypothetical protein [Inediibacterium massiliense]|uniref:hypothetical protein n=1 Tax=Inediibacterium massiliense TaxID=1658111 RepID=UPI0018FE13D4